MDEFYEQVRAFVAEHDLLPTGSQVVAGISGGADSLALLLVLDRMRQPLSLDLSVAHVNHGLRGKDADDDEAFVRNWCLQLGIPFFSRTIDIHALAEIHGTGLEDAGRQARMAFFTEMAPRATIALAHHQNDQAETLLLHLGRGSGLDGLVGMMPRSGRIVRPLLGQTRQKIEKWLQNQAITWRQDATNADDFALRNRLRNQVLPVWQQALGYDPATMLCRTAELLAVDQQYLDELARKAIRSCRSGQGLDNIIVLSLPYALQNRVLRLFWTEQTGSRCDLSLVHIQQLQDLLPNTGRIRKTSLPGFWRALSDGRQLTLEQDGNDPVQPAAIRQHTAIPLRLPGVTIISQFNLQITALLIENESEIVYNNEMEYFRLDRIKGSEVRLRLPGDRIHPFGRQGGKLLKKFLNEQKIRQDLRDKLPLVALENEIVWLPGYAAGARFVGRPDDGQTGALIRLAIQSLIRL